MYCVYVVSLHTESGADTGFCEGGGTIVAALLKAVHRGAKCRSVRAKRGKFFSPLFSSYQDGLSWHLRALHCKFQMYEDRCCMHAERRRASCYVFTGAPFAPGRSVDTRLECRGNVVKSMKSIQKYEKHCELCMYSFTTNYKELY